MVKHKSFVKSRQERTRKPVAFSFDWEHEDVDGNITVKTYKFLVKASFAVMESIQEIEQEVAEKTQGDPDLNSGENRVWVFKKTGEILEVLVGEDTWNGDVSEKGRELGNGLKHELDVEDAMELLRWIGDELASEREQWAGAADSEDGDAAPKEIGPEDVPEEGKQGEGLASRQTTS